MKSALLTACLALLVWGCLDEPKEHNPEETSILDNLPMNDRDLLLAPLERALDDLRKGVEADESLFHSKAQWNDSHVIGTMEYKLDGPDTVMVHVNIWGKTPMEEEHSWYYDKKGTLFYSEHHMRNMSFGYDVSQVTREYKFYFEEAETPLSSYGKTSFDQAKISEWTPACLTKEEEQFLQNRLAYSRRMAKESLTSE